MKLVLSWLKEYVDVDLPLDELARRMTMLGLEVEDIRVVGLPMPAGYGDAPSADGGAREFKIHGLSWDPDKIVVASISEVMPHPNADRLVLCQLDDGQQQHVVLTGAPNLYPYKGQGPLAQPLKVAYAKEGARIYDGHQPGQVLTTLKRAKIRGVESYSMVASEKELGISDEHEGVMILDADAPTGMPLVNYLGDAVLEVSILPNMIRNASVLGVARELAAALDVPLRMPELDTPQTGPDLSGRAAIEIRDPQLNPRFVLGLIEGVEIGPSPYRVQERLRLAGMRPINNVVDATNYVMLELGQPLHAFDYDKLVERAGGGAPTIITRTAQPGERLTTLDGVDRALDPFTVLVCDQAGALSIAGVMGGAETEVTENTRRVLLEGAAWNFINIRKTVASQRFQSEAAYRFSRGVHPALAETGVRRGLNRMLAWSGGSVAQGLVDEYPLPAADPLVVITPADVKRLLGIELSAGQIAGLLERLEFQVNVQGEGLSAQIHAKTPPHRLDIGEGVIGKADLVEEIARHYGYTNIPPERLTSELPPQRNNPVLQGEERLRDLCADLGLQEVITYRLTAPEREARLALDEAEEQGPYLRLLNPITPERSVMRRSLLASVLDVLERNDRTSPRLALFELGRVFHPRDDQQLPDEIMRLVIAMRGPRSAAEWDRQAGPTLDFYDLKGVVAGLLDGLQAQNVRYEPADAAPFHPGKCARVWAGDQELGLIGELHPRVKEHYDLGAAPVLAADLSAAALLTSSAGRVTITPVPVFPPILEDIAVVVDETVPAAQIESVIRQAGGKLISDVRLFDIFRGEQLGAGKKSLAYSLTYLAPDRTLTDADATQIRQRVIRRLESELGAKLRS